MAMGERIQSTTGVPIWVWGIAVTLFLALMSFTISVSANSQRMSDGIDKNEEAIIKLEDEKASKEKVDMTYDIVVRLESKVDELLISD